MAGACAGEVVTPEPQPPVCDGVQQPGEETVDAPFDKDGDGYFDASDLDCLLAYGTNRLDCDDEDPELNPGKTEIPCNGLNDDCNGETPDAVDLDEDGTPSCRDCNDENPIQSPDNGELCWDGFDNDCDLEIDEACPPDFNGIFVLDEAVDYDCKRVALQFSELSVQLTPPDGVRIETVDSDPGVLTGRLDDDDSVGLVLEHPDPYGCNERYILAGAFTSEDRFEGTLTAEWGPKKPCYPCLGPRQFTVTGTRSPDTAR